MKIRLNKNDKILLAVEVLFMIVYRSEEHTSELQSPY